MRTLLIVILLSSSLSAAMNTCRPLNSFEQGYELKQNQMNAAYMAPARIDVRGSWDLYFAGNYIFWQPSEENLELGISNVSSTTTSLPINGNVVDLDFKYKSGFQLGMGIFSEFDNWDGSAEYTWLTGHHSTRSNGPLGGGILPFWGHPTNTPTLVSEGKSCWKFTFDFLDLVLGRSCYLGTRLTLRPFFGARAAWINQKYKAIYTNASTDLPYEVRNTSISRGIGPEVGLESHWLLGSGLRLIGNAEADLLFTTYHLRVKEQSSSNPSVDAINLRQRHLYYLRPHLDLEMGLGWGTYLDNHNYHIDLSATYGFQIFWNQNMFRNFIDYTAIGKSSVPNGDLFIQGVASSFRIDF